MTRPKLRVLSLGAGVQSTTLALMAAKGEIEPPDCAIFADTGWEPKAVYRHLDRLEGQLPFPVHRVSAGDIRATIGAGGYEPIPWYVAAGPGRRQCTYQYKLRPIRRRVRSMLGDKTTPSSCEMWVGISRDEAHRMKPADVAYIVNRWPLVELGLSRADCRAKLARWGVEAPRLACCGCPFLSDEDWRHRQTEPEWPETVALSRRLAASGQFMHRSLRPLDEVDFGRGQRDLFGEDCTGGCFT